MEAWRQELYLQHHGILGQKWGKRNGPPYPLSADDYSKSEKIAKRVGNHNKRNKNAEKTTQSLKILSKSNEVVELHEDPVGPVAKFFAKIIPSAAKNQKNWKDYTIKNKDGVKVGEFTSRHISDSEMNLVWLGVRSKYEGNGYGQSAMRLAVEDARKQGYKYLTLEVPTESPNARHIYEKLGFKDTGEAMIGDDDDVWGGLTKMRLNL